MKQKKVNCVQKVEMLFIEACYSYKCYIATQPSAGEL